MTEQEKKQGWFKKFLDKYNKLCDELGVEQGGCRGCVPVVKFDPENEEDKNKITKKM